MPCKKKYKKSLIDGLDDDTKDLVSQQRMPTVSELEKAGVEISRLAQWSGRRIFIAFAAALEDSNFHTLRTKILELWNKEALPNKKLGKAWRPFKGMKGHPGYLVID